MREHLTHNAAPPRWLHAVVQGRPRLLIVDEHEVSHALGYPGAGAQLICQSNAIRRGSGSPGCLKGALGNVCAEVFPYTLPSGMRLQVRSVLVRTEVGGGQGGACGRPLGDQSEDGWLA